MKRESSKAGKGMDLLCDVSIKESNISLLYEKYPEIAFPYACMEFPSSSLEEESEDTLQRWRDCLPLEGIDTLYVFGIGYGHYQRLVDWLKERKERALIFLEYQMSAIDQLLEKQEAQELLQDPQVSICYVPESKLWDSVLQQCALAFPSDRVELVASSRYQKKHKRKAETLRLTLLRKAALVHSLLSEALHYHVLTGNLAANFSHIEGSSYVNKLTGTFNGVPAIICGAGPSLASVADDLKKMSSHALIFSGGSAITALASKGVRAHITMALDPNYEEYTRLQPSQSFGTPFFYASRIHPGVFDAISSPLGYMTSDTGGSLESWLENELSLHEPAIGIDLSQEALSVTTLAISLAHRMGCSPILFCGVDLAYTNMQRYSDGVMASSAVKYEDLEKEKKATEKLVIRKDRQGNKIHTLVKWVMEASCLGAFAKKHGETLFFKCTDAGLEIPGVPYKSFQEILPELKKNSWDLHGRLHAKMQETLIVPSVSIPELMLGLLESLARAEKIIKEIVKEVEDVKKNHLEDFSYPLISARRSVFEMDLEEEACFSALLSLAPSALERLLQRKFWTQDPEESLTYRSSVIEKELCKWKQMLQIVKYCQVTLSQA